MKYNIPNTKRRIFLKKMTVGLSFYKIIHNKAKFDFERVINFAIIH